MKASIVSKLDVLVDRHKELGMLLSDPVVIADQDKYRLFSTEYSELEQLVSQYKELLSKENELAEISVLLEDTDPEIKLLASSEKTRIDRDILPLEKTIETLLLPRDPNDTKNVFLEIRAGTGGDEAAIFSGDLFRMYSKYAEASGWRVQVLSNSDGDHGGYKEIIARIEGKNV